MTKLPRKYPVLTKMYLTLDCPDGPCHDFKRYAYQLLNNKLATLVQYFGDEEAASHDFPHSNRKHSTEKNYIRTCPSYLNKFKSLLQTNTASTAYKKAIAETCSTSVTHPRNMKQLRNLRC